MISFCPLCGNSLHIPKSPKSTIVLMFKCRACPYQYILTEVIQKDIKLKPKRVDYIHSEADAWNNVESTEETCPECSHPRAYFLQIQIRSADEPMTTFYKCCNHQCSFTWRD